MADAKSRGTVLTRRNALIGSGLLIAVAVAGREVLMSPREAEERGVEPAQLDAAEAETLAHLGEAMVPGAKAAGIIPFVDSQIVADPNNSLLIARYFGVEPPYGDFYRAGLKALDAVALAEGGGRFAKLPIGRAREIAKSLLTGAPAAWKGPPAQLFYFCVRSDAVDVVFGTPAGFETLGIPYMEHIMPPRKW